MSEKKHGKKHRFLSVLSSQFRVFKSRPPSPDNAAQARVDMFSSSADSEVPTPKEPLAGSSRLLVNESSNHQPDQNMPNPQRPMAMISQVGQVHIGVGHFTQIINTRDDNILKNVAFQSLPRSHDAAFSAAINLDNLTRRPCTKGTRVDIIAQISAWTIEKDPAKAPPVYWLTGLAGLGKTTIAYTICELLHEAHLPFASFFCSLQLDSKNSKLLVPTLCRNLAELDNSYAVNVLPILETKSEVVDARLRTQIDELLAKPWQASIAQRKVLPTPIVIVVDALDESDRGTEFLEELLRVIHAGLLAGIKFLVTSRPDPRIVNICESFPPNAVCKLHEVNTADVQNDIEKYLREALPELKDEPELALLSQRAGGLFIYATTAVRFISPPHHPPSVSEMRSLLQDMLNPGSSASHPDDDERLLVDELYERVLGDAFRNARVRAKRLRILHTIMCAESRVNMSVLADLANADEDTVKRVVESLHAVLFVSPKDGCVYWFHSSFLDFVFSQARARISFSNHLTDVFCDGPAHHGVLASRCFSIMQDSLHFNMCALPSSCVFDSDIPGLNASIDKTISPVLRYVSRHWARHLLRAVPAKDDTDDLIRRLKGFLCDKLLFWIEAMNLTGVEMECSSLLQDAESWVKMGKKCPDLLGQLADATDFSTFFAGSPASKSTPHLYISTLSMWNQDSPIWRNWKDRFRFIPAISLPRGAITIPLLTIPTDRVTSVALSSDGNRIVSGSEDKSARVWDARTGEQLRELQGHTQSVTSVAFSPDCNRIVSGSRDNSVRVWDTKTGVQLKKLQGHIHIVTSVAFSSGGQIVSGSRDKSARVWDANKGVQLRKLQGHTHSVDSVAFSPDGNRVVSGSFDRSVRVWDAKTGMQLRKLQGHIHTVTSVIFSSDGNRIVSGSKDSSVRVWDSKTGEQLMKLQGTSWITSVAFYGNRILSGSSDKSARVWDANTGVQLRKLQGHTQSVTSVAFSSDGNRILSGSDDNSVSVWDAKTDEQLSKLQGHTNDVNSVSFSPDGNRIVSGSKDKSVRVWDANTGEQLRELQGLTNDVNSVSFSPDGNRIVSGSDDNSVRVWDTNTGVQLSKLQGHTNWVTSVAFSSDGNRIVSGSEDKSVRVWDARTGEHLRELQGHTQSVTSVAFSSDGDRIVSGSKDSSVRVWDANTSELLRELQGHTQFVTSVAFSPDGDRIVSGSKDSSVRVWDANTGELLRELQGHTRFVTSVAFSPDGNRIVSGSTDKSVRVWSNLNLDPSWVMNDNGWILSDAERLVWVPSTICSVLLRPYNTLNISPNRFATISFEQCKLGPLWCDCYTP